jgi:hypothetical protein
MLKVPGAEPLCGPACVVDCCQNGQVLTTCLPLCSIQGSEVMCVVFMLELLIMTVVITAAP